MLRVVGEGGSLDEEVIFMKECLTTAALNHHFISPSSPFQPSIFFLPPHPTILRQTFPLSFRLHQPPTPQQPPQPHKTSWDAVSFRCVSMQPKLQCSRCGLTTATNDHKSLWRLKFKGACMCGALWFSSQ